MGERQKRSGTLRPSSLPEPLGVLRVLCGLRIEKLAIYGCSINEIHVPENDNYVLSLQINSVSRVGFFESHMVLSVVKIEKHV